ncbi:hypothetical protein ANCCEY_09909 [Ancylostoma ceylanicum]|uniref:Reverse transcriptase domain-containing protein n=1 Tax=Ancylostoma ceylanicum TaxID=53326 RepID=A0A0D6LGB1_9BILA|nr:hypothetical protein ANCCEY_09909 [Ancylostoma ceylanicum]
MLDAYQPTEQAGFRKGFCCMDHIHTIIQLIERVDPAYLNILEQCNIGTTTTIQLFDKKLHIPIEKGVRQGDTISPKLFTSALQYAMSRLNWEDKGLTIDGTKLSNLRFADDIVLISDNTLEVNQLLNELNEAGKAIGLEMNMKTQMMANQ